MLSSTPRPAPQLRGPVVVLHNRVAAGAPADERDVLAQVDHVVSALGELGHEAVVVATDGELATLAARVRELKPRAVFNLVESLEGSGRLACAVPALLEHLGVPYTGADSAALLLSTDKPLAKRWMRAHGIPTPDELPAAEQCRPEHAAARWIVKPASEDASVGIDDAAVVTGADAARRLLGNRRSRTGIGWFAEHYLDGREFNVSLLADGAGIRVLPVAEIVFEGYPREKPRIVGYAAKWTPDSFECRHTLRRFVDDRADAALADELGALARRCWEAFGLRGYARVDIRLGEDGGARVLEVNANPCLAPDAGFAAALGAAGVGWTAAVAGVLAAAALPR